MRLMQDLNSQETTSHSFASTQCANYKYSVRLNGDPELTNSATKIII